MIKQRNSFLDILKAIAIILMILGHCIQHGSGTEYASGDFFKNPFFIFIYSFHMPLFMLISGYLFAFSLKTKPWYVVLFSKFKQLVIPLACWSVVSLLISIVKSVIGISPASVTPIWIIKQVIYGFIYGPWFLWALWWCSLVIILVKRFLKGSPVIYILGCLLTFVLPDFYNLYLYKFMWPFFLLGYLFNAYDYETKLKKVYRNKTFILGILALYIVLLHFYHYDSFIYTSGYTILGKNIVVQIYNNCFRFIIGLVGSIAVILTTYAITRNLPSKVNGCLTYIGTNTFGIYILSNLLVTEVLSLIASPLTGINYALVLVETFLILIISLAFNALLKKFRLTNKLLLGGR